MLLLYYISHIVAAFYLRSRELYLYEEVDDDTEREEHDACKAEKDADKEPPIIVETGVFEYLLIKGHEE